MRPSKSTLSPRNADRPWPRAATRSDLPESRALIARTSSDEAGTLVAIAHGAVVDADVAQRDVLHRRCAAGAAGVARLAAGGAGLARLGRVAQKILQFRRNGWPCRRARAARGRCLRDHDRRRDRVSAANSQLRRPRASTRSSNTGSVSTRRSTVDLAAQQRHHRRRGPRAAASARTARRPCRAAPTARHRPSSRRARGTPSATCAGDREIAAGADLHLADQLIANHADGRERDERGDAAAARTPSPPIVQARMRSQLRLRPARAAPRRWPWSERATGRPETLLYRRRHRAALSLLVWAGRSTDPEAGERRGGEAVVGSWHLRSRAAQMVIAEFDGCAVPSLYAKCVARGANLARR